MQAAGISEYHGKFHRTFAYFLWHYPTFTLKVLKKNYAIYTEEEYWLSHIHDKKKIKLYY